MPPAQVSTEPSQRSGLKAWQVEALVWSWGHSEDNTASCDLVSEDSVLQRPDYKSKISCDSGLPPSQESAAT